MKEFVISEVKAETAVLVGLITKTQDEAKTKEYLDELEFLADTAGAVTVKRFTQKVVSPNQTTYVGKGKLEEIKQYIKDEEEEDREIGMVIFDDELSAKQITKHRAGTAGEDSRPYLPHPRHLRHACPDRCCQDPGGVGTIPLHAATTATTLDSPGAPGWWFRFRWRKGFCWSAWTG